MKSLLYRILNMEPTIPLGVLSQDAIPKVMARIELQKKLIRKSQAVCVDNVAEFLAAHSRDEWDITEDIPNYAPPLSSFFLFYNQPSLWNVNGRIQVVDQVAQCGMFVLSADLHKVELHADRIAAIQGLVKGVTGIPLSVGNELVADAAAKMRWLLCCDMWTAFRDQHNFSPQWNGIQCFIFVDEAGKYIQNFYAGVSATQAALEKVSPELIQNTFSTPLRIFGLSLSFMHCKNVVRTAKHEESSKGAIKFQGAPPSIKYHVLDINPMKEVLRTEGQSESNGMKKALHICRGHFATYSDDKPLFGKYVGTFWKPDHVRGTTERGVVVKDYNVKAGATESD